MTADVNVTEKAHAAALARWALGSSDTTQMLMSVDAALAALADPEVLAGIAGVLTAHRREQVARINEADQSLWVRCQACGALVPLDQPFEAHQAAALGEWLRGERA